MDIGTHALASFALMRAAFPRAPRAVWLVVIVAGIVANIDGISAAFGPAAYLIWHLTFIHSLLTAVLLATLCALLYLVLAPATLRNRFSPVAVLVLTLLAGCLHLAMDVCQSDGLSVFWPISTWRIAADWLPTLDPIILAILIAGILLPELLRLVGAEIGAKDKKPRGQTGAIIALSLIAIYVGARATLHSNAIDALESVSYRSELPRRVAAYPVSTSLSTWNGIVETESALHEIAVNVTSAASVNPDAGVTLHKPEASPLLDTARGVPSAAAFLRVARFPKATIEKTESGFRVELRDLRYAAAGESERELLAIVELNPAGVIVSHEVVWARDWKSR
jgi:inner membrane protein